MSRKFSLTVDCGNPDRLAHFWADALGYQIEPPPGGFETRKAYWRSIGLPEEDLEEMDDGRDSVIDPEGVGLRIWFQKVPEGKVVQNRVHLDLHVSGGRSVPMEARRERVNAEAESLAKLGATKLRVLEEPGVHHYAVAMQDPKGNELDLN